VELRPSLPEHPVPASARGASATPELRVEGLVDRPLTLGPADLGGLPRVDVAEPFTCEEGWQTPALSWHGVRLRDVLDLAAPRVDARWVRVSSGDYAVPIPLEQAATAMLADEFNGEPLATEHGGPWRLVLPGASCFTSVKWVDRLELTGEPGDASGERIARARLKTNA